MSTVTSLPTALILLLVLGLTLLVSIGGLLLVRRLVPHTLLREHNDVAGFIFAGLAVIYAVLLAFVVIAVWEAFEDDESQVEAEATSTINLYREVAPFSSGERTAVRDEVRAYVRSVVNDEWPRLSKGHSSEDTQRRLDSVWASLQRIEPANESQVAFYSVALNSLKDATHLRQVRLDHAGHSLPPMMIVVLLAGAVITVAYTYLYGVRNIYGQAAMTAALAAMIALAIVLIVMLDLPFRGSTSIGPAPFEEALQLMEQSS